MLETLLDPNGLYNEVSVAVLGDWPAWLLMLLGLASVVILVLCWRHSSAQPRHIRLGLLASRFITVVLIWLMFLEVSFRLEKVQQTPSRIAVLVDQSRSMSLPISANDPRPRLDGVMEYLADHKRDLESLALKHRIDYFGFGDSIAAIDPSQPVTATDSDTDFLKAVSYLGDADTQRELVGAIILSDGVDTRRPSTGVLPTPIREAVQDLGVLVYTVEVQRVMPL